MRHTTIRGKPKLRVLIVDDHPMVRSGVRAALEASRQIQVVGESPDAADALKKTSGLSPDVVLVDMTLPNVGGLELIVQLKERFPKSRPLVFSMNDNKEFIIEAMRRGASGYVLKDAAPQELIAAIHAAAASERYFSKGVSQALLRDQGGVDGLGAHSARVASLTTREKEILGFVTEGLSSKQIAQKLSLSTRTVETHRHHIMAKLDVHSTPALLRLMMGASAKIPF